MRNGFLGGGDSLSQDLAAGKCRALLTMGCGLARNRGTLSVGLATGKWFAEDGWDQMIEDKGHGRRSSEVSSCSQWGAMEGVSAGRNGTGEDPPGGV